MRIDIDKITRDRQCQPRSYLIPDVIDQYAEAMAEGAIFPPVVVFHEGDTYWLADGFHRVAAAEQAGLDGVRCEIQEGTIRDAMLYSVGANATHGLRRTNQDKRQAVETLIEDPEWSKWSNVKIAETCAVHQSFVARMRESLSLGESEPSKERTYTDRWGNTRQMNTDPIGKRSAGSDPDADDDDIPEVPSEVPSEIITINPWDLAVAGALHDDQRRQQPTPVIDVTVEDTSAIAQPRRSTLTFPVDDADDEEFEEYDRSPSTPEQCQSVVTALEALFLARQRPEEYGLEHVTLTEVIEYLTTHANAADQKWMITGLDELSMDIVHANLARAEALAALRAKAS